MEASGNLAGIFMPLLSKDDNIPTRLTRAAYLYALRYWETLGGIGRAIEGAACGVLQLARDAATPRPRARSPPRPAIRASSPNGWKRHRRKRCSACRRRMAPGCSARAAGRGPAASARPCSRPAARA
jgi:hypothetical protein